MVIASRKLEACEAVADEVRALGRRALAVAVHALLGGSGWPGPVVLVPVPSAAVAVRLVKRWQLSRRATGSGVQPG